MAFKEPKLQLIIKNDKKEKKMNVQHYPLFLGRGINLRITLNCREIPFSWILSKLYHVKKKWTEVR